jgi:hypothetical protein
MVLSIFGYRLDIVNPSISITENLKRIFVKIKTTLQTDLVLSFNMLLNFFIHIRWRSETSHNLFLYEHLYDIVATRADELENVSRHSHGSVYDPFCLVVND